MTHTANAPSGGITRPPYYRPTPDRVGNNLYYPSGQEELGPDGGGRAS